MPIAAAFTDTKLQRFLETKPHPPSKGGKENEATEDGIDQRVLAIIAKKPYARLTLPVT
jgi:hypothetical protein